MSVNRTVARTRSRSNAELSRSPVTNSLMSPTSASTSPAQGAWSPPGYSMYLASGICAERAPCCNRNQRVGLPVEHKGWNAHGRQDRGDVDHHVQRHKGFNGAGARGEAFKLRDLLPRFAVRRLAGPEAIDHLARAPDLDPSRDHLVGRE